VSKPLDASDFRAYRWILEPDDFLISNGEDQSPTDLIPESIWKGIIENPDDVSIRTSSHYGSHLKRTYDIWSALIESAGDPTEHNEDEPMYMATLEAADELMAALFNSMSGYYRVAAACLRSTLEPIVIGAYCQFCEKNYKYKNWRQGTIEIKFGTACDKLHKNQFIEPIELYLQGLIQDSIFGQKKSPYKGGSARRLFEELSIYTHSRPGYTSFDQWEESGPKFEPKSFIKLVSFTYETVSLCFTILKLTNTELALPAPVYELFHTQHIKPTKISQACYEILFCRK
jgi:hypothetical protein